MYRILIVEDDFDISELLQSWLTEAGYQTAEAEDGLKALEVFESGQFDLVLLDLMLPRLDGFGVCEWIRKRSDVPIVMLTALDGEDEQLRGYDLRIDDYVTKPFSPIVLAARVRTLLKREGRAGAPLEQLGKLSVNELRREVMVENKPIDLTPKEYELLIYFKNNRAIALSRESILNAVWGYDYFGDLRTVDTHVKKLRAKLGECGTMIETVRGYGYRFEV